MLEYILTIQVNVGTASQCGALWTQKNVTKIKFWLIFNARHFSKLKVKNLSSDEHMLSGSKTLYGPLRLLVFSCGLL